MKFKISRLGYYFQTAWVLGKYIFEKRKIKLSVDRLEDLIEIKEIIIDREYHKLIGAITDIDRVIVDIGGGMGDFAIMTAFECPWATVYSFEPDKVRCKLLNNNKEKNGVKNVREYELAITDFNQLEKIVGSKIDVLKIDCEGYEFDIIGGASIEQLKKVGRIVMEYHNWAGDIEKIVTKLKKAGFKCSTHPRRDVPELGLLRAFV